MSLRSGFGLYAAVDSCYLMQWRLKILTWLLNFFPGYGNAIKFHGLTALKNPPRINRADFFNDFVALFIENTEGVNF